MTTMLVTHDATEAQLPGVVRLRVDGRAVTTRG
jgi:hypothetical protein